MKTFTQLSDFSFYFSGYGHYKVTYTNPGTYKKWTITTSNMSLIDETKNAETPTKRALNDLKRLCKQN